MTIHVSTACRNRMLTPTSGASLATIFAGGTAQLIMYSGTVPTDADQALSGNTALCTITLPATAWAAPASGVMSKTGTWSAASTTAGTVTFYRIVTSSSDPGTLDNSAATVAYPRIQGSISTAGADLNLSTATLTGGAQSVDYFSIALPTT